MLNMVAVTIHQLNLKSSVEKITILQRFRGDKVIIIQALVS